MSIPADAGSGSSAPFTLFNVNTPSNNLFNTGWTTPRRDPAADALAQQRAAAIAAAQQAALAAKRAAEAAAAAAAAARAKATASKQAADKAQAAAAAAKATQAQRAQAKTLRAQATADEAEAEKKEAAADLAQKDQTLKDSLLDDTNRNRAPDDPSAATVAARVEYDAADKYNALVNQAGGSSPAALTAAQARTKTAQSAAVASAKVVANAKANGGKATTDEIAKANKDQSDWIAAMQDQMRVAAAEATVDGKDPNDAVDAQLAQIVASVKANGYFDPDSLKSVLTQSTTKGQPSLVAQVKAETPAQRALMLELGSAMKAGQPQVADAQADYDKANAAAAAAQKTADAATAAAGAHIQYGPYVNAAAATSARNTALDAPTGPGGQSANQLQAKAAQLKQAATTAKARLDALEQVYGHTDAKHPDDDTLGLLQADYEKRGADLVEGDARTAYLATLADPASTPAQQQAAYTAWQHAVDGQTLATQTQAAIAADAKLLESKAALAAAQKYSDNPLNHVQPAAGPFGTNGITPTFTSFDAQIPPDYANAADREHVKLIDGRYWYVNVDGSKRALDPAASALWGAHVQFDADTQASKKASAAWQLTVADQGTATAPGLDIDGELLKADQYSKALADANTGVTQAKQNLQSAIDGCCTSAFVQQCRIDLGAAMQAQQLAQAQVDKVDAMRTLRSTQLWGADASGQPADVTSQMAAVRTASQKVDQLQTATLSPADEKALRQQALPQALTTLKTLDAKIEAARPAPGAQPDAAYSALLQQRDFLSDKIDAVQSQLTLVDAQRAALAAPDEYGLTQRPTAGADLHSRDHNDANDSALTWGITPGNDGNAVTLAGLPSNIKPSDVKVTKDGNDWFVTFDKSSGAFAMRAYGGGKGGGGIMYTDGSHAGDIAIEKGRRYKLNPDAAKLWEATNTNKGVGNSALVVALDNAHAASAQVQADGPTDGVGKPIAVAAAPAPVTPPGGSQPIATISFNVDQTGNLAAANANVTTTQAALATAKSALAAGGADPAQLQAQVDTAQGNADLAKSQQDAIKAVFAWQQDNQARQFFDVDTRAGRPPNACYAKPLAEVAREQRTTADTALATLQTTTNRVALGQANAAVKTAQGAYDQWRAAHPYLLGSATDSQQYQDLQAATAQRDAVQRDLAGGAVTTAVDAKNALIAHSIAPGHETDPQALYDLFDKNPEVMAQDIINATYAQMGGMPTQMHDRTEIANAVALSMGYAQTTPFDPTDPAGNLQLMQSRNLFSGLPKAQQDGLDKVVDQIVDTGGDTATVTALPVVYATKQDGIQSVTLFKVENGGKEHYVDEYGERYSSIDDYRANNNLPVDGVKLVMPRDGDFKLDANGNVELYSGDARTETGWQHFKREVPVDAIVGGLAVVGGLVLEFGSGGLLTPIAGALVVGGLAYGVGTGASDLISRSQHGLGVNPFSSREAGMDWLNIAASLLAVPELGVAGRAGALGLRSEEAAAAMNGLSAGTRTVLKTSSQAAKYTGYAAMADGGEYMAENWSHMSASDRSEQGGMFLLNLLSTRARPIAEAIQARGRSPTPVQDAAPATARQPVLSAPTGGARTVTDDLNAPITDGVDGVPVAGPATRSGTPPLRTAGGPTDVVDANPANPVNTRHGPAVAPGVQADPVLHASADDAQIPIDATPQRTAARSFTSLDDAPVDLRAKAKDPAGNDTASADATAHHDAEVALYDRLAPAAAAAAALIDKSPTLKSLIVSATRKSVNLHVGEAGGGSFTVRRANDTTVVIDPEHAVDPAMLANVLAHELSHARVGTDTPLGLDSAGSHARGVMNMADEGEARLVQLLVRDEVLRAGGPDLMPGVSPRELEIFDQAGRTLDLGAASRDLGTVMAGMHPSTNPDLTYAQLHGADHDTVVLPAPADGDAVVHDIHAHHGGANAGAYMRIPGLDAPRLKILFELTSGKVLIQRVPQTAEPYYLVREVDGKVYETSMTRQQDGSIVLARDIVFKDGVAPPIKAGRYTRAELVRAGLDFADQWPGKGTTLTFNIEPGVPVGYRGTQRDVGLIDEVHAGLDPTARRRAFVGLTAPDPAAEGNVEALLSLLNYANKADPDGSWLRIPGLGETTLVKEGVTAHLDPRPDLWHPQPIDRLAAKVGEMGGMMVVHSDSGKTRVIGAPHDHGLLVHGPSDYKNVKPLLEFFGRHPHTRFVWAHAGGLGRTVQPGPGHIDIVRRVLSDRSLDHVSIDLSWDVVSKYIGDRSMQIPWSELVNAHPDRFIYGSDSVAASTPKVYGATLEVYRDTGFLGRLHEKSALLRGNFDRLVETTSDNVTRWRLANKDLLSHYPLEGVFEDRPLFDPTVRITPPSGGETTILSFPAPTPAAGANPPRAAMVKGSQWPALLAQMKSGQLSADGDVYVYRVQGGQTQGAAGPVSLDAASRQLQGWMILPQGSTKPRWLGQSEPGSVRGIAAEGSRKLGAMGTDPWDDQFQLIVTRTPPQALRDGGAIDGVHWIGADVSQLAVAPAASTPAAPVVPAAATSVQAAPVASVAVTSPGANAAGRAKVAAIYGGAAASAATTATAAYAFSYNPEWTLDPNLTGPVSFIYRGTVNSLRGRLAQRIDFHARELTGASPASHLDWLQRTVVGKGGLLGIKASDRATFADAIATLRKDGGDADALQVLDGASKKLLSPGTPLGVTNSVLQWGTLGVNNANSAMWFHQHGFDPSNPTAWSTAAFLGANLGLSAVNNASTFGIWSRLGALKDRTTMKVTQTLVMGGYASGSLPLALNDALTSPNLVGFSKAGLDVVFGSGAAWAGARDIRTSLSRAPARDPRSYRVAPGIILGGGVAARMALQLLFPPGSAQPGSPAQPASVPTGGPGGTPTTSPFTWPTPSAPISPGPGGSSTPGNAPTTTPSPRVHARVP